MRIKLLMAFLGCLPGLTGAALAAAPVTLVENGKPAATIVIADEPTVIPVGKGTEKGKPPTIAYAAEELQSFIEKASGARLEIVPAAQAPASGHAAAGGPQRAQRQAPVGAADQAGGPAHRQLRARRGHPGRGEACRGGQYRAARSTAAPCTAFTSSWSGSSDTASSFTSRRTRIWAS